jgi:Predicted glycosyltransferases
MKYSPIALFVYNRPWHTQQTIEALLNNAEAAESDLIIFSDGSRDESVQKGVSEVRDYITSISGFRSVKIVEREKNLGLARSVISGVTEVVNKYGRIIVLEDDLVTSPCFLRYMNDALERYKDEDKVMQISGYMFPVDLDLDEDALFLPFTTSWGWGTWERAWNCFDASAKGYKALRKDRKLRKAFDLDGAYPYFKMLESQLRGEIDSWAIRWNLSVFMEQGLVLFPKKAMVKNIGFDGSGRHCGNSFLSQTGLLCENSDSNSINYPAAVSVDDLSYKRMKHNIRSIGTGGSSWARNLWVR